MKSFRPLFLLCSLALAAAPALATTVETQTLSFDALSSHAAVADTYLNLSAGFGVSFGTEAQALANGVGPSTYTHAPSAAAVMVIPDQPMVVISPRAGQSFVGEVSLYFSTSTSVLDAVQIYSGANGTGDLLGAISLSRNATLRCSDSAYCNWQRVALSFPDQAQSIVLMGNGGHTLYDNITLTTSVPEPTTMALLAAGLLALGFMNRSRRQG